MSELISRQALCEYALNQKDKCVTPNDIMRFPFEQPERKRGHYIKGENGEWYCSECKRIDDKYSVANFCWYCGADMRTEGNDDDTNA